MSIESVATVTPAGELRQRSAAVTLLRRPLLLAFVLGCGVSLLASGRFTPRLVVDGTLSFAFVPVCELIAYAIVYRLQRGSRPFAQAAPTIRCRCWIASARSWGSSGSRCSFVVSAFRRTIAAYTTIHRCRVLSPLCSR